MKQYHDLLKEVLNNGIKKEDRTGTGTISLFGCQKRYDLRNSFPLITTKKIHWKSIVHELIWFLNGDTNIKYLNENGVKIWNEWADKNGELGPIYGKQWRSWIDKNGEVHDQIKWVIEEIKRNPNSRRLIVSSWNVGELNQMALAPCHTLFQFYVNNGELSCQLYQRSADLFLGVPFNIASYSLLTYIIAKICNLKVGDFIHTIGDAHIYLNHLDQVNKQLNRELLALPTLKINNLISHIDKIEYNDLILENYVSHMSIPAPIAI